jgi:hypothetical protein
MPRAAPVTSATFVSSGRTNGGSGGAGTRPSIAIDCPVTNADRADSRNLSTGSRRASPWGPSKRRLAVEPRRPISLARLRTNPSSAPWAAAIRAVGALAGGRPSKIARPHERSSGTSGWKKS